MKNCKIVCDGKDVATISFDKDGMAIKCTQEGRKLCADLQDCCK